MKKIYHLKNCNTCQRIIGELAGGEGFELQNIKEDPITTSQIEAMKDMVGSYEALFSRRAMKYRAMGSARTDPHRSGLQTPYSRRIYFFKAASDHHWR
jgi:arsenate reductase-like glutaredoxin family protein